MKQEIKQDINNLRRELRNEYERIGNLFYLINLRIDEYLEMVEKGLGEEKE